VKRHNHSASGLSLLEISICIGILLALGSVFLLSSTGTAGWTEARQAGDVLRAVTAMQRLYLADHPSQQVSTLTTALLEPYIPDGFDWPNGVEWSLPTNALVNGQYVSVSPTINVTVFPAVAWQGGAVFDPTPSTCDGLWDAGGLWCK
jgi:type II secretory pathway pseudopilin PulG